MSKLKIEKPYFPEIINPAMLGAGKPMSNTSVNLQCSVGFLNDWFDEHVEPINKMLAEGIKVNAFKIDQTMNYTDKQSVGMWTCGEWNDEHDTHKALLINIEPIKKETAEDIAREIYELLDNGKDMFIDPPRLYTRLKAAFKDEV